MATDAAHSLCSSTSSSSSSSGTDSSQPPMKRFKLLVADTYRRTTTASSTHQTTVDSELLAYCSEANSYSLPVSHLYATHLLDSAVSEVSTSCSCGTRPSICIFCCNCLRYVLAAYVDLFYIPHTHTHSVRLLPPGLL